MVIGCVASYGLTRFLASQIWGVSATDPWTFGTVAAIILTVDSQPVCSLLDEPRKSIRSSPFVTNDCALNLG